MESAAALLVEVVGLPHGVAADTELISGIAAEHGVRTVRVAADDAERALLWKGRKSAFGAIARIKPNYYLHDTVVPRAQLPAVLAQVYEITARHDLLVLNVFHAGDGNLHPLLVYDGREPGVMERVHAAGEEIVRVSVAAGGVLSGEHGIGLEKRDLMPLMFSPVDLAAQAALRGGVRSARPGQPRQGAAEPGRVRRRAGGQGGRRGRVDLTAFAQEVGVDGPVTITGLGTRGGPVAGVRSVGAPSGIDWIQPAEMTVSCGAGTMVAELDDALLAHGQCVAIPPSGTVGGALAVGRSGVRRLGYGPVRDAVLQARYVSAAGEVVKAGGPTVKNVSGFDVCRLLVGSRGTLGFLGDVILRTRPRARYEQWFSRPARSRRGARPAVPPDVGAVGRDDDVGAARGRRARHRGPGRRARPARRPAARRRCRPVAGGRSPPSAIRDAHGARSSPRSASASCTTPIRPAPRTPDPASSRCTARIKRGFDPTGRLNPGVDVLDG